MTGVPGAALSDWADRPGKVTKILVDMDRG